MTVRELFDRRSRTATIVQVASFALMIVGFLTGALLDRSGRKWGLGIAIASFFGGMAGFVLTSVIVRLRCPWCAAELGAPGMGMDFKQIRFCASCGRSLDDKLPATGKPTKGHRWDDELA